MENENINPLVELTSQLGYPVSLASVHETVQRIQADPEQKLLVASKAGFTTGWVHVFLTDRVESGRFAEIGGLVVDRCYRRQGVGRLLIEHAAQ